MKSVFCTSTIKPRVRVLLIPTLEHFRSSSLGQGDGAAAGGPYEDEEARLFYESLPDLRGLVPSLLLGSEADAPEDASQEPSGDVEMAGARLD